MPTRARPCGLHVLCVLCRYALPEEDFEIAMRAYEWPKKVRLGCALGGQESFWATDRMH